MSATRLAYAVEGWGIGELWLDGPRLVWHELPYERSRAGSENSPGDHELIARIARYFDGERVEFGDVELELDDWTPFQLDVLAALRRVSYGDVVSYGEVAQAAGHPNAQRAVGTFCARNRFPLVVPCHRVVAADGLGAYGSLGPGYKRRLLELEGVAL